MNSLLTNFPNGLSSFGVPVLPGIPVPFTGKYFFVDPVNGADGNSGLSVNAAFKSLYQAHAKCTAGNNDVVFLIGNGASTGTSRLSLANAQAITPAATSGVLAWTKNACHLIGIGVPSNNGRARIAPPTGTYTVTTFGSANFVTVSATGCLFANLSVYHGFSTGGAAQICWTDSGGRNAYSNCQFQGMNDTGSATDAGSRSLLVPGTTGENTFSGCIIGDDTTTRTVANSSLELAGGTPRNSFRDCLFPFMTSNAGVLGILGTGAACVDRWTTFERCQFINAIASTSTQMTVIASFTNGSPGGMLLFKDCLSIGSTKFGDTNALAHSYLTMPAPSNSAGGLAVAPT